MNSLNGLEHLNIEHLWKSSEFCSNWSFFHFTVIYSSDSLPTGMEEKEAASCLKRMGWSIPFIFQVFKCRRGRPFPARLFCLVTLDYLLAAGFWSLLTLEGFDSSFFPSSFLTSGEVLVFGVPLTGVLAGEPDGLAAGVETGVEVTGGLVSGAFAFGSQAPNIPVEAAITAAKTIDLLIVLFFPNRSYSRFFQEAYNP